MLNLEVKGMPKHGNLDLDNFNKSRTANEPNIWGNSRNFPKCKQIIRVAVPNEGNR